MGQIIAGMEQQQKRKLAILDFANLDGSADNFTRYLTEQLATHMVMARRNFNLLERKHLDKILVEHGLNLSGIIDPQNAKQVGKLSGIDAIVTGTVADLQTVLEVNARLIDTETGKVFSAAVTRFTKDREVLALIGPEERKQPQAERRAVEEQKTLLGTSTKKAEDPRKIALATLTKLMANVSTHNEVTPEYYRGNFIRYFPGYNVTTKGKVYFRDIMRVMYRRENFLMPARASLIVRHRDIEYEDPKIRAVYGSSDEQLEILVPLQSNHDLERFKSALGIVSGREIPYSE